MGKFRSIRLCIILSVVFIGLLIFACGDSTKSPSGPGPGGPIYQPPPAITPEMIDSANYYSDTEAALMALWYCDGLIPSGEVYVRFRDALRELRWTYWHDIPAVKIRFIFPAVPSQILVSLTDSAITEFRNGTYHAWDSLNVLFHLRSIDSLPLLEEMKYVRMSFEGRLHPDHLRLYYEMLPGVTGAEAIKYGGDWPNLYPWILDDKVTFLARDAWGDCPAGCTESHFYYFKEADTGFIYIGDWQFWTPVPDWWAEGRTAFCAYTTHSSCN